MKKYSHYINLIIVFLILVLGLFAGHFFLFRDIKIKNENISTKTHYLDTEIDREDYVIASQRLLQNLDSDIKRVRGSIVPKTDSEGVEFIENLEALARGDNLVITIDNLVRETDSKSAAASTSEFIKVSARVNGSWTNVYKFVSQLESLPYKLKISSLVVSKSPQVDSDEKTGSKDVWQSTFEFRALKYK